MNLDRNNLLSGLIGSLIGTIVAIAALFAQLHLSKKHHQDSLASQLIPVIASNNPSQVNLALELLRENLESDQYEKFRHIIEKSITAQLEELRSLSKISNVAKTESKRLTELRELLIRYEAANSDWKSLIERNSATGKQILMDKPQFFLMIDKIGKSASKEVAGLLDFASKHAKQNRCDEAFVALEISTAIDNIDQLYDALNSVWSLCPIRFEGETGGPPGIEEFIKENSVSSFRRRIHIVLNKYIDLNNERPKLAKVMQIASEKVNSFETNLDSLASPKDLERQIKRYLIKK